VKYCESLHPMLYLFFIFLTCYIKFGREEQYITSSNMYIYTYLLFYDAFCEAKFMQPK
jgi:hypothetical protein